MKMRIALSVAGVAGTVVLIGQIKAGAAPGVAQGGPGNGAAGGGTKDLIVCRVGGSSGTDFAEYTTVDGISAYAFGTTSQNNGDVQLAWIDDGVNGDQHPVIAQNLFRLKDGRFEQIGMSWLKHGFCAADASLCGACDNAFTCDWLGVGCSDTYTSALNGNSFNLGPRSEVNPVTGIFDWPHSSPTGDNAGRLLVDIDDVDPDLNVGARYFGESQYITKDDAGGAQANNNNSYREVVVGSLSGGIYNLSMTGSTVEEKPAIQAWVAEDPTVSLKSIDVPDDGRFMLGTKVTDNGDGTWTYEYAMLNMNSHRAGQSFGLPVGDGVTLSNIGFHDLDHHSGEPFDGTDWSVTAGAGSITWATQTAAENIDANALRWGTLYNFRYDADSEPQDVTATLGLFLDGTPDAVVVTTKGPSDAPVECVWDCADGGDGTVGINDFLALLAEWEMIDSACDVDGGGVGITDFLDLLGNWGPCP